MEEIKRMIEEAKLTSNTWLGDKGFKGSYIFTKEELFSLLEKVSKGGWSASRMSDMGHNWYSDDHNNYWEELRKEIDN